MPFFHGKLTLASAIFVRPSAWSSRYPVQTPRRSNRRHPLPAAQGKSNTLNTKSALLVAGSTSLAREYGLGWSLDKTSLVVRILCKGLQERQTRGRFIGRRGYLKYLGRCSTRSARVGEQDGTASSRSSKHTCRPRTC